MLKPLEPTSTRMSENSNSIHVSRQVAVGGEAQQTPADPNEIQQLSMMIKSWRENQKELDEINAQVKEKKKRGKVMEEVILRIMKKNNIGALDLQSSGGRLLYRRQTAKAGLGQKDMARLLAEHLKSEQAATTALQYIAEHRGTKVKESLLYEKD